MVTMELNFHFIRFRHFQIPNLLYLSAVSAKIRIIRYLYLEPKRRRASSPMKLPLLRLASEDCPPGAHLGFVTPSPKVPGGRSTQPARCRPHILAPIHGRAPTEGRGRCANNLLRVPIRSKPSPPLEGGRIVAASSRRRNNPPPPF